jgi:hypothetical protein
MTATKSSQPRSRARTVRKTDPPAPTEHAQLERSSPYSRQPSKDAAGVAEYIAAITAELAGMAGGARLDMLTYFLNMARLEAEFHMRRQD